MATSELPDGLMCSAFLNPDGTAALVLLNDQPSSYELSFTLDGIRYVNCTLPAHSVSSFRIPMQK